ncbi:hypothetical protein OBBRIDRAFT_762621 [Obba rivulosa]|uniref:Uncharacterized protein n=1 Tax=Obba rivulosa TaxID=1052685 RepID=A0A8E2AS50_9APHY|nr:hypothetical protein OBBRIDRAFT_762621 [Obba rivulosa]
MALALEIIPFSHSIDMYGEPDCSSAYSLSGYVKIRLTQSYMSLFERRRTARLLLQSLVVTFEGQSELITQDTGYSAIRLCSISQELTSGEPFELSNEGAEDSGGPAWTVVFNLTIPGWLPPTALFGEVDGDTGTRYGLYATARFTNLAESPVKSWFSFCGPFRSRDRTAKAPRCEVQLNRFMGGDIYTPSCSTTVPSVDYAISTQPSRVPDSSSIPAEIASSIRVLASVPEFISVDEKSIPLTLRLRAKDLAEAECKRLRVSDFFVELEQVEDYRISPTRAYTSRFPLPPPSEQPPKKPLLVNHPLRNLYEIGLADCLPPNRTGVRAFSLLPEGTSGRYELAGDGYIFAPEADTPSAPMWYLMKTQVPFAQVGVCQSAVPPLEEDGRDSLRIRESGHSPLFSITHRLHIALTCTYDLAEGENPERALERLTFSIPIAFARTAPSSGVPPSSPATSEHSSSPSSCDSFDPLPSPTGAKTLSSSSPYTLPAYSQLFDMNGERKIDYSIPLPLYTPPASSDSSISSPSVPSSPSA